LAESLSPKQDRIINFIAEFLHDKGYPPSIRDIAEGCGISSTSVVAYNLNKLEEAGYIKINKTFKGRKPYTSMQLTKKGRIAYQKYLLMLKKIVEQSNDADGLA